LASICTYRVLWRWFSPGWVGNQGRSEAMSDTTRRYVDMFWELLDEILNAVLLVLIGMEVLLITTSPALVGGGVIAVLMTMLVRALCVGIPVGAAQPRFGLPKGAWKVVTWGGLRGGISVALALSLPPGSEREAVVALTYSVVVSSSSTRAASPSLRSRL
jgi:CPA1 family monovalent cation:H+ antiporter